MEGGKVLDGLGQAGWKRSRCAAASSLDPGPAVSPTNVFFGFRLILHIAYSEGFGVTFHSFCQPLVYALGSRGQASSGYARKDMSSFFLAVIKGQEEHWGYDDYLGRLRDKILAHSIPVL